MQYPSMKRRDILSGATALSAGLAFGPFLPAAAAVGDASSAAITKPIPSTGERLPVIGLGTNQYGVQTAEEMTALQEVLEQMAKLGGSVVDTARGYGRSEEVIGDLLRRMGNRERFFLSTKTPVRGELGGPDMEVQTSLDRLKVDRVDLMLIHNLHGLDALMPALIRAKEKGRTRYIGMSTSTDDQYEGQMAGMRRYPLDFIQVDYSIANRGAADAVLPLAQERGMAVLVNVPFGGRRDAAAVFGQVANKPLPGFAADIGATSWAQFFLKYVVSHPAVTVAIPGTTKFRHLVDNQGAGRGRLPDAAMRREMERYWDTM
jgi:aryl-alcohol dehydrogenase-like predicted oxidoreductase